MTTELYLKYGSTYFYFERNDLILLSYVPTIAPESEATVEETIECLVSGADGAALEQEIGDFETAMVQAGIYAQTKRGNIVYLYFKPDGDSITWRSQVSKGEPVFDQDTMDWGWLRKKVVVKFKLTRNNYFENSAETELSLSNGNGSGTGGIKVFNCNDGTGTSPNKKNNWVDIDATGISGQKTPLKLVLYNNFNDTTRLADVWIGNNAYANPTTVANIIEGEDTLYPGSADKVASASDSGGYYMPRVWASDSEQYAYWWVLDKTFLDKCQSRYFRVVARFHPSGPTTDPRVRLELSFPATTSLTLLSKTQELKITEGVEMQDLGVLQLPPWLVSVTGPIYPLDLIMMARRVGGFTLALDCLFLVPLDSYRYLYPKGYGADYGVTLVDDGILGEVYTSGWDTDGYTGHYIGFGEPIHLFPGRAQRLSFAIKGNTESEITRTLNVRAYYRKRKRAL